MLVLLGVFFLLKHSLFFEGFGIKQFAQFSRALLTTPTTELPNLPMPY